MLNTVIVEDNVLTAELISGILETCCPQVEIKGVAHTVVSAVQMIKEKSPNLVLFDVNLPKGTSFDILNQLEHINFKIIFITSFDKYAIKAIKLSALDYLLKPVDANELTKAIKKAEEVISSENTRIQINALSKNFNTTKKVFEKLVLKTQESVYIVDIKYIIRCESGGSYTFFYLNSGKKITVSKLLKEYDELLHDQGFVRVHQSHLINVNYIERFDRKDGGLLIMQDGTKVPVSYRKKDELFEIFDNL